MDTFKTDRILESLICVVLGMVFSAAVVRAAVTGTILGRVTDPSGAAIPAATVTLRNTNTGLVRTTITDATGSFEFLLVPVGNGYIVQISKEGFETSVHSGITLLVNEAYSVDAHLRLGALTERVNVSAAPAQVQTISTQLGNVIGNTKMEALPLNGRSFLDLLSLQAGVAPTSTDTIGYYGPSTVEGEFFNGALSVNGNEESSNSFLVNGGDVNDPMENSSAVDPVLDSIQEFRILTSSFDAEYGHFSGGIVNVVTKSGTNQFHGDLFEFIRNNALDSRNFFDYNQVNPITGQEIPGSAIGKYDRNQFGGTLGGPILKNRLFFFGGYQGTRQVVGVSTGVIDVPSVAERSGDFSNLPPGYSPLSGIVHGCAASVSGTCMNDVLSQELGYPVTNGEPYYTPGCTSTANCVFPNAVIPQKAFSSAAAGTMKFLPLPTATASGVPFYETTAFKEPLRDDKFDLRIDYDTRKGSNWSAYYHFDDSNVINPYWGGNVPGFAGGSPSRAQQADLGNTQTFGATKVNEWRLNYVRYAVDSGVPTSTYGQGPPSDYGFVPGGLGIIPAATAWVAAPIISLSQLGITVSNQEPYYEANNTYQAKDDFSTIVGKHTLKFGGDFEDYELNEIYYPRPDGNFGFAGSETGNDFADYIIGAPSSFSQMSAAAIDARSKYFGIYAQDSYRVTPNLTLNYGLRWEFSQPFSDTQGRFQAFVPGEQSVIYPGSPKGWVFPGDPGIPSSLAPTRYDNFAPRVGIAYSPSSSNGLTGRLFGDHMTSVRASYGIFYTAFQQYQQAYEAGDAPFAQIYTSTVPVYFTEPYAGREGVNPGQRFPYVEPPKGVTSAAAIAAWAPFYPITGTEGAFDIHNALPYVEATDFSLQRQLGKSTILTLSYVGTFGHHLLAEAMPNPGNRALCLQIRQILGPANGCGPFGEESIYTLPSGQTIYGTEPYSVTSGRFLDQGLLDFGDVTMNSTIGNSAYDALEVSVDKKVGPVQFLAAYTQSKALGDSSCVMCSAGVLNPYNNRLSESLSAFDVPHNFVVSYTYDLPFQKLFQFHSGFAQKLINGWQLTGVTHFATGFPVLMGETGDQSLCDGCSQMPDYNAQPLKTYNPRVSASHQYFSTGQFSETALGVLGTANSAFFSGPGINDWDMSFHKTTQLTERTSLELRLEFFNIFNHAQFEGPVGTFGSPAFGEVTGAQSPRIGQIAAKFYF